MITKRTPLILIKIKLSDRCHDVSNCEYLVYINIHLFHNLFVVINHKTTTTLVCTNKTYPQSNKCSLL